MPGSVPLVSVIVPCYNAAPFVAETILSVVAQTYQHWEIILIDDGSKDNTIDVIQPFLEDTRIKLHIQENQGVSATRNRGISLAQGDFIAFLDSDDVWKPEMLHRLLEIFQKYPDVGVCGSLAIFIDADGHPIGKQASNGQDFYGWASAPFVSRKLAFNLSSMVRRSVCERLQSEQGYCFDEVITSLAEDFDFWLRCSSFTPFYQIDDWLFFYRQWGGNATSRILFQRQDTVLNVIVPRFLKLYGGNKYVRRKHVQQLKSFFCHERGSNITVWSAKIYWFIRSILHNPYHRDAWGALGYQMLPKAVHRWLKNWVKR